MNIKTYIVNLKDSVERRKYVLEETAKYPFMDVELIEAVNGKQMTDEEIDKIFNVKSFTERYFRKPTKGEIGCTLSHRKCYNRLLSGNDHYVLILEDDVSFIHPEDTEYVIREGVKLLQKGKTDIVLFIPSIVAYNKPQPLNAKYKVLPVYSAYETCAYLINRRGAKKLLKCKRPGIVADDFLYMHFRGMRIKSIYPNIAEGLSTIGKMNYDIENDERCDNPDCARPYISLLKFVIEAKIRGWGYRFGWLVRHDWIA